LEQIRNKVVQIYILTVLEAKYKTLRLKIAFLKKSLFLYRFGMK